MTIIGFTLVDFRWRDNRDGTRRLRLHERGHCKKKTQHTNRPQEYPLIDSHKGRKGKIGI